MPLMSRPASTTYASLTYITLGALTDVWSGVWFWYLREYAPASRLPFFFCYGFLLTGLVLLVIGLGMGQLGRAARSAELPPTEVTTSVARRDEIASENPSLAVTPATSAVAVNPPARGVPVVSLTAKQ